MEALPLRLRPGDDLRRSLEDQGRVLGSAFVVCGIGSLQGVSMRLAGEEQETGLDGSFELLSLSGTLSNDGAHLHMAVADARGQVLGGHVCYGNEVRTTAEILIARVDGWELIRELDEGTGFKELAVRRPGGGDGEKNAA